MPQSHKSEENRPVILVNNAWKQLSLKGRESLCARMRMRTEAIFPGLAARGDLQRCTAERTGGGQIQLQLSNFRMSRVIFVTRAAVAAAVCRGSFCTIAGGGVCVLMCIIYSYCVLCILPRAGVWWANRPPHRHLTLGAVSMKKATEPLTGQKMGRKMVKKLC